MRYKQTCDHILVPRAAILLASASDRDKLKASSDRFQSVLATDWSDGNTIKNDNRKKSEEKGFCFLFAVLATDILLVTTILWIHLVKRQLGKESYGIEKSFLV